MREYVTMRGSWIVTAVKNKALINNLVQDCLRHFELWAEFGDGRKNGERGRVGVIQSRREHSVAEAEAEQGR